MTIIQQRAHIMPFLPCSRQAQVRCNNDRNDANAMYSAFNDAAIIQKYLPPLDYKFPNLQLPTYLP